MSKQVEFNFNIHIPYVLKNYRIFDIGKDPNFNYFDENKTKEILNTFANLSYLEVNRILYSLIKIHKKNFQFSLTITGVSIEIMKKYNPKLLEDFKKLVETGCVNLRSTFYHSLNAPKVSRSEILEQIEEHKKIIEENFGVTPVSFAKNFTEFKRFPINSEEVVKEVLKKNDEISKLSFNYDFFGIENNAESGVFEFLKHLPSNFLKNDFNFVNENSNEENIYENNPMKNQMQHSLSHEISSLEEVIKSSGNQELIENWKRISSFDYIQDIDQESFKANPKNDFLPHNNSYDLYINLKNIIEDMNLKLQDPLNQIPQNIEAI